MLSGHEPTVISKFGGLYSRGDNDQCPLDHFVEATNIDYSKGDIRTRFGSALDYTLSNIKRVHLFKKVGEATRVIILDSSGRLFDASVSLVTQLVTIPSMTDFSLFTYYNRAYITPHDGILGIAGQVVYVYDGTTFRQAAGHSPTGFSLTVTQPSGGHVETGTHLIAIAYETASGFITKPGPATYGQIVSDGSHNILVESIPTGPPGTVARHVLVTAAIETYSGRQDEYELFYQTRIANNTDTSVALDFYDNELLDSADGLLDLYEDIPAGVGFADYNGRLALYGIPGSLNIVLMSNGGEPEAISAVDGLITTDPKDSSGIRNCREFRGQFYMMKSLQSYTTQDNGDAPNTWATPVAVDKGYGAEPFSVADVLDAKGAVIDTLLVANRGGLLLFNGSFVIPELTWKIEAVWKRINKLYFHKVQVILDPINHLIYIAAPLDAATNNSHLLVGYYSDTVTAESIRWSIWEFDHEPTCICADVDYSTQTALVRYASSEGNVYKLTTARSDNSVAFTSGVRFPFIPMLNDSGNLFQLGGIRSRIRGSGLLQILASSMDNTEVQTIPGWNLASAPGADSVRQVDMISERISVKFFMNSIDEYFILSRVALFIKQAWAERPM